MAGLTAEEITRAAQQTQQEFAANKPTPAELYMGPASRSGPPSSRALAGVPMASGIIDEVESYLQMNHRRTRPYVMTGDARLDSSPNRPSASEWHAVDQLQRSLLLAGYLNMNDWRHLRRHNLLGIPEQITRNALKEAQEDAAHAGMSVPDLLTTAGDGVSVEREYQPSAQTQMAGPDLRANIRHAFAAEIGRAPTRAEMAKFERVYRNLESAQHAQGQAFGRAVFEAGEAGEGESVAPPVIEDAPNAAALVSEQLQPTGEATAHRVRESFDVFRRMIGVA